MRKELLFSVVLIITVLFVSGCKDITDSYKPGSFGSTPEEDAMVKAITSKYGDMTADGSPRFLEAMMTSHVRNFVPIDRVTAYSQDSAELIVWFVYDNFDTDVLTIEWVYLDDDYSIHTFTSETGDDFGRGSFILDQPDDGWPLGSYRVTIKGAGVTSSVDFDIIDGPTVSKPLDLLMPAQSAGAQSQSADPPRPGWYLIEVIDRGDKVVSAHQYYTYDVDYERGDITTSVFGDEGETLVVRTISSAPPDYIPAGGELSIRVRKEGITVATQRLSLTDSSNIVIDAADIDLGAGSGSHYRLKDETYGEFFTLGWEDSTGTVKEGVFVGKAPAANMYRGKMGIKYEFFSGTMYGTRYLYEWRD